MSMNDLMAFVETTLQDAGLVAQLSDAVAKNNANSDKVVSEFAKEQGFDVDAGEVALFKAGMKSNLIANGAMEGEELSDHELELVAGGSQLPIGGWLDQFTPVPASEANTDGVDWQSGFDFPICVPPTPKEYRKVGFL